MRVRCTTRLEPFPWGTALFNADFDRVWDLNYLRVDRPDGAEADQLIAEADRLLGEAGYQHRQVEVLGEPGARMAPRFLERGWTVFQGLFMVQHRQPTSRVASGIGEQITWEQLRVAEELHTRGEPYGKDEETVRQIVERTEITARSTNLRCFGARDGERVVSYAYLYSDGEAAQIESVATLADYRRKGLSHATLQAALDVAHAEEHDFIFLVADNDDWPKDFYAKLGFDPVGILYSFRRNLTEVR